MARCVLPVPRFPHIHRLPLSWAILMTSLGAVVAMNTDLYGVTSDLNARTFRTFELFAMAAIIFYVIVKIIQAGAWLISRRLFRY